MGGVDGLYGILDLDVKYVNALRTQQEHQAMAKAQQFVMEGK